MKKPLRSVKESFVFSRAYKKGKSVVTSHAVLYLLPRKGGGGLTLGITVSKKLGGAVERNRVKRLVREATRLLLGERAQKSDAALIVVARSRAFSKRMTMPRLRAVLEEGYRALGLL